jgi:hypothetical protein
MILQILYQCEKSSQWDGALPFMRKYTHTQQRIIKTDMLFKKSPARDFFTYVRRSAFSVCVICLIMTNKAGISKKHPKPATK